MRGLHARLVISAVALYITYLLAQWLQIGIELQGWQPTVLAEIILALVNALIRPLVMLLAIPLNCLTLGLFTVIVNALMFWLVGSGVIPGFRVEGFLAALFGSLVMGVISGFANSMIGTKEQ